MVDDILRAAYEALRQHIRDHSAIIYQVLPDRTYIGSATCVEINDRLFLATAAHNFDVIAEGGTATTFSARRSLRSPLTILAHNYGVSGSPDVPDVAWLEVDRVSANQSELAGIPLRLVRPHHALDLDGDYDITGFIAELTNRIQVDGEQTIQLNGICFNTIPTRNARPDGDELVLDYNFANTENGRIEMPHPAGISGGAIWHTPLIDENHIWTPAGFPLVGIVTHYRDLSRQIIGLPMHHWLELLLADRPEVQPYIEPILNP